ncbi:MAG: hypothetical protein ABSG41_08270 [Bryobacteraceae bacterium]|jgi:hypothetical protein
MRTERQTQASRANGAKSSGPATPEGKLASSRNATTHGMLSGTIVLEGESKDRFRALLAALHEELQPRTPIETSLVENMAVARWRQMRIWGMEKAGMEHEMRRQAEASQSTEDTATRSALAFRALSDDSRSLELINRYESRYDRQYLRAHRRLLELRDRRTPPPAQPAVPDPPGDTTFPSGTPDKRQPHRPAGHGYKRLKGIRPVSRETVFAKRTRDARAAPAQPAERPIHQRYGSLKQNRTPRPHGLHPRRVNDGKYPNRPICVDSCSFVAQTVFRHG